MSAAVTLPRSIQKKENNVPVKCLLWRICPVVTVKEREGAHKGDESCREFVRLLNSAGQFMAK